MPGFAAASLNEQAAMIALRERNLRTIESQYVAWLREDLDARVNMDYERVREMWHQIVEKKHRLLQLRKDWHALRMAAERGDAKGHKEMDDAGRAEDSHL